MKPILLIAFTLAPLLAAENEATKRLGEAADVFSEVMKAPDSDIPLDLLEKSHCIVIVPGLKTGAFVHLRCSRFKRFILAR